MNLPDTHVWLAHAILTHSHHSAARDWFARQSAAGSILMCRQVEQSFLRLLTLESVMRLYGIPPLSNAAAWGHVAEVLRDPRVVRVIEPRGIETPWKPFAVRGTASPKLWMDAYLAAFARAGEYRLITFDGAFTQFAGLDVMVLG